MQTPWSAARETPRSARTSAMMSDGVEVGPLRSRWSVTVQSGVWSARYAAAGSAVLAHRATSPARRIMYASPAPSPAMNRSSSSSTARSRSSSSNVVASMTSPASSLSKTPSIGTSKSSRTHTRRRRATWLPRIARHSLASVSKTSNRAPRLASTAARPRHVGAEMPRRRSNNTQSSAPTPSRLTSPVASRAA